MVNFLMWQHTRFHGVAENALIALHEQAQHGCAGCSPFFDATSLFQCKMSLKESCIFNEK